MGSDTMKLKLITVLVMFVISSDGQEEKGNPEQDVKIGENCEYPPSCSVCFDDIANVISLCLDHPEPECMGSILYALSHCPPCLCDILADQIHPDLVPYLCPLCPKLDQCTGPVMEDDL